MPRVVAVLIILAIAVLIGSLIFILAPKTDGQSLIASWWSKKTREQRKKITSSVWFLGGLLFAFFVFWLILTDGLSGGASNRSLSESTRRKIFYDMIAVQDQNPYSDAWNQGVKEAAAESYNVPLSTINQIIREGASNGWLQPPSP